MPHVTLASDKVHIANLRNLFDIGQDYAEKVYNILLFAKEMR